jgi:hypothetical protein
VGRCGIVSRFSCLETNLYFSGLEMICAKLAELGWRWLQMTHCVSGFTCRCKCASLSFSKDAYLKEVVNVVVVAREMGIYNELRSRRVRVVRQKLKHFNLCCPTRIWLDDTKIRSDDTNFAFRVNRP